MKLKAKTDIVLPLKGTLKAGSVIDNISTDPKTISFKTKSGSTIGIGANDYGKQFDAVADTTPVSVNLDESKLATGIEDGVKSFARTIQLCSVVGLAGGLGLAYKRGSKVGGYIGWGLLFATIGSAIGFGIAISRASKKIKDATK